MQTDLKNVKVQIARIHIPPKENCDFRSCAKIFKFQTLIAEATACTVNDVIQLFKS